MKLNLAGSLLAGILALTPVPAKGQTLISPLGSTAEHSSGDIEARCTYSHTERSQNSSRIMHQSVPFSLEYGLDRSSTFAVIGSFDNLMVESLTDSSTSVGASAGPYFMLRDTFLEVHLYSLVHLIDPTSFEIAQRRVPSLVSNFEGLFYLSSRDAPSQELYLIGGLDSRVGSGADRLSFNLGTRWTSHQQGWAATLKFNYTHDQAYYYSLIYGEIDVDLKFNGFEVYASLYGQERSGFRLMISVPFDTVQFTGSLDYFNENSFFRNRRGEVNNKEVSIGIRTAL